MAIIPTWSTLRIIGRSPLASATVFIPIVGYFVIFNEEISKYLQLLPIFSNPGVDNPNLTRLISLYLGLFSLGIASIIFYLFCPQEVSQNVTEHDFIVKEIDIMNPFRFQTIQQELSVLKKYGSSAVHAEAERLNTVELSDTIGAAIAGSNDLRGRGLAWNDWINRNKKDISSILSLKYQLLNKSKWVLRVASTGFYLLGFVFVLIPSVRLFIHALMLVKPILQYFHF